MKLVSSCQAKSSRLICAYCHDGVVEQGIPCNSCHSILHAECWRELEHCPSLGCQGLPSDSISIQVREKLESDRSKTAFERFTGLTELCEFTLGVLSPLLLLVSLPFFAVVLVYYCLVELWIFLGTSFGPRWGLLPREAVTHSYTLPRSSRQSALHDGCACGGSKFLCLIFQTYRCLQEVCLHPEYGALLGVSVFIVSSLAVGLLAFLLA